MLLDGLLARRGSLICARNVSLTGVERCSWEYILELAICVGIGGYGTP